MSTVNLANLSKDELKTFFESFDNVLCDCDGVIFVMAKVLEGVSKTIEGLKKLGKTVKYVTNNSSTMRYKLVSQLISQEVDVKIEDIINPTLAIIDYLKRIKFDKKVYLISLPGMRNDFIEAGIQIANDNQPDIIEVSPEAFAKSILIYDKEVGAVVVCFDFNMTYTQLNKAHNYISNPDVLFITAGSDRRIIVKNKPEKKFCLGPAYFHDVLKDASGRESIQLGKPHVDYQKYVQNNLKCDPSRTLFVGDSLDQDMSFAHSLGYQKLLVLTGNTTIDDIKDCDECTLPDYFISGLGDLHKLMHDD